MTVTLRSYQLRAVAHVRDRWARGITRVCLVAPTGSGKTTMGAALARDRRVLWLAHRRELIDQAATRLRDQEGLRVGVICPGFTPDLFAPVQVCTIQTALAREIRPEADLVIADECHHYAKSNETWASFLDAYADKLHLGLTATPER